MVTHIRHEMDLHLEECADLGLSKEMIESHDESLGICGLEMRRSTLRLIFLLSLHRLQSICPRHWSIGGLARPSSRSLTMSAGLCDDRETLESNAEVSIARGSEPIYQVDRQLHR